MHPAKFSCKKAFTFIEIMVTVLILSFGLLAVYRTFMLTLDQMTRITNRLYANTIIDNRVALIERKYRLYNTFDLDMNYKESVDVGYKIIDFKQNIAFSQVENLPDLFKLDIDLNWKERDRDFSVSRSAYISNFIKINEK